MKTLILGGARSGKSAYAEQQAALTQRPRLYLATATAGDGEMVARIGQHQARRGEEWQTVEEGLAIAPILLDPKWQEHVILVDCLTLWISNVLVDATLDVTQQRTVLCDAVAGSRAHIILVSNEVGLGITPMNALARQFIDEAGWLHQQLANVCDRVIFVAAGLPLVMKAKKDGVP